MDAAELDATILKIKEEYLKIIKIAGAYSCSVKDYESSGGAYPEFILKTIDNAKKKYRAK